MITFTLFQFTVIFELLFFLLWAFPNWANLPAGKFISQKKENDLLVDRSTLGSCDVEDKCGLCTNTTKEGGAIESPAHFRDEDAPDLNCSFNIQAPAGSRIQLAFTEFVVDQCCDFITVSDGENDLFELRFNGSDIPEPITSPSSQIVLKFTINSNNTSSFNSTVNSARWQARYKFLADKNPVSQLETVNMKPSSTSNEI